MKNDIRVVYLIAKTNCCYFFFLFGGCSLVVVYLIGCFVGSSWNQQLFTLPAIIITNMIRLNPAGLRCRCEAGQARRVCIGRCRKRREKARNCTRWPAEARPHTSAAGHGASAHTHWPALHPGSPANSLTHVVSQKFKVMSTTNRKKIM
jgi:hypothetical protein